jgi:sigma-B regulation protein RsbU (phosphoserine phosphatase)
VLPDFLYVAESYHLEAGDTITLFTDGVTDALDREGEFFGMGRVDYVLRPDVDDGPQTLTAQFRGRQLVDAVQTHSAGRPQNDDIAIVCFGRLPDHYEPPSASYI